LSSIASYFRTSSSRTEDLKEMAAELELKLLTIPKLFEIRWTEWTYVCVKNILRSWHALVVYFQEYKDYALECGYFKFLTNYEKLKQIVSLADLLQIFQHFHKNLQSDSLTIVTLKMHINALKNAVNDLKNDTKLIGGWEERLSEMLVIKTDDNDDDEDVDGDDDNGDDDAEEKLFLKGIELTTIDCTRGKNKRQFQDVRNDMIETLLKCINERFQMDEELTDCAEPFIKLQASGDDLRNVHKIFAPDLSLAALSIQYNSVVHLNLWKNEPLSTKIQNLTSHEDSNQFDCVITVFSRIQSCTPQSADVERCVKANNLLKTTFRRRLALETENKYIFVHYNMPPLQNWNPRKAIVLWIKEKERRQHEDLIKKGTAIKQPWYAGIFEIADDEQEEFDENYLLDAKQNDINF
jgi:hypothetical protein